MNPLLFYRATAKQAAASYNAETLAIISRANTEGFTLPGPTALQAISDLIDGLKSNGLWTKEDIIFNFALNNTSVQSFTRINWRNPSGTMGTYNGSLIYQTSGILGNATDGSFDTNFVQSTSGVAWTAASANVGCVVYSASTSPQNLLVGNSGASTRLRNASTVDQRLNRSTTAPIALDLSGTGWKCMDRSGTAGYVTSQATDTTFTYTAGGLTNGFSHVTHLFTTYSNAGISMIYGGGHLTSAEVQTFRTLYNTFLTAIGLTAFA